MGDRASGVKGDESSIYEPGYSKIRKIPVQQKTKSLNVDEPKSSHDLYSKVFLKYSFVKLLFFSDDSQSTF